MARSSLTVVPPLSGLDRAWSFQSQPPFTLPDALNCRTRDVFEQRARLGSRPGIVKAFPQKVSIPAEDPLVESFGIQFGATKDNSLSFTLPDNNNGTSFITMGAYLGAAGRAILHFDMNAIPNGATIINSALQFFLLDNIGNISGFMTVRLLNQLSWVENLSTWNKYDATNSWSPANDIVTGAGPTLSSPSTFFIQSANVNNFFNVFDMGPLVQEAFTNHGKQLHIMIKQTNETNSQMLNVIASKENSVGNRRPRLSVTYEV